MTEHNIQDESQRQRALNPEQSFIVQAPAGSGKTELLTQRFLVLLSQVNAPEEILAITFTKKASAEMRARLIKTLKKAASEPEPTAPHEQKTWNLAKRALKQNELLNWNILENPNRLRIQTIDAFNASLIKYLPILSHFGAPPEITDDSSALYREAVQEFLSHLEENVAWSDAIAQLLMHMDNNIEKVQELLINMLAKRDQWTHYMMVDASHPELRFELENHLSSVVGDILANLEKNFPKEHIDELLSLARFAADNIKLDQNTDSAIANCADLTSLPGSYPEENLAWLGISELLFTKDLSWRKSFNKNIGFPSPSDADNAVDKALFKEMKQRMEQLIKQLSENQKLQAAFLELHHAPADHYQENQWALLNALYQALRVVLAQLTVVFRHHGKIDYIENAQAALFSLGTDDHPTDLALTLDYQIRHLLIDEFQDTSNSQYRLLQKLTAGWEQHDGRTLFVVGDPMQSIYRFREAEVGLFIRARKMGIGQIALEPLTLSVNFRSTPVVVEWVNKHFQQVLPPFEDIATGAVPYSHSIANQTNATNETTVETHAITDLTPQAEADAIVTLILQTKQKCPTDTIAILVRARTHLDRIIPALKMANLSYRAIDIDPLDSRQAIQDLIALTRALLHPGDRVAWLAILRARWCGLTLADLLLLTGKNPHQPIIELLEQPDCLSRLSQDGQQRLARITPLLGTKLAQRRRYTLRLWIESTWLLLGGPAGLDQSSDLDDVNAFFKLLEKLDVGSDLINPDNLINDVSKLFAAPNNQSDNSLQIMTIHNSKGLEFDTVILPGLERQAPNEKKQLLQWMEKPREDASHALILAPVHATGEDSDPIYDHIKKQNAAKNDHEVGRLLYVAATRAKKRLHLFFRLKQKEDKETNPTKSMLAKLWPAIKHNIVLQQTVTQDSDTPDLPIQKRNIKRLTTSWSNPIHQIAEPISPPQDNPGFTLSQDNLKNLGKLIHQILEQISRFGIDWWKNQSRDAQNSYINTHLIQLGMISAEISRETQTIHQAIENTLQDSRGQWILQSHAENQSEIALTAVIDQNVESLVIDRTFVDENGIRWIIDYKTAHFAGSDISTFLAAEKREHEKQMKKYFSAIQQLDKRPIHLGLYFPLIPAWIEWNPDV